MALSFEAFFYGIQQIESGGNYKAVGPMVRGNRAYGKYQVMDFNIGPWTQQYYGRRLTPTQFLNNKEAQEAVARGVLRGYYNQYGADGAAAKWFSGSPNPNSNASDGYNTVRQYVAKMNAAAAKYTGGNTEMRRSAEPVSPEAKAKSGYIDPEILAEQYGFVSGFLNSVPELRDVFARATKERWESPRFQAALKNTNWWKTHTKAQRDYLIKAFDDPASFREDRENARFKIAEMTNQLGLWNAIGNEKLMNDLIWGVLYNGWSDAELKYHVANVLTFTPEGTLGGAGGEFQNKMASAAWANGVRLDPGWYMTYYKMILQGVSTEQQALQDIRNRAASAFPGFRDQIMAGQNVMDIASPYIQGMGQILEINPSTLDLFDPTIMGALNYRGPSGQVGAKPLWQFEVELRKDPRWTKTGNAREGLMTVAHKVAQDFGMAF